MKFSRATYHEFVTSLTFRTLLKKKRSQVPYLMYAHHKYGQSFALTAATHLELQLSKAWRPEVITSWLKHFATKPRGMKNGYCQDPPIQLFLLTLFTSHRSYYFITFYSCMTYQARSLLTAALLVLDSTELTSYVIIDNYWSIFQLLKYKIANSWGFYLSTHIVTF